MFFCRASRLILVFVYILLVARPLDAQVPSILSPAASAPAQASPPPDPLKRETPKGSLLGFIKAAGEERYNVAIGISNLPRLAIGLRLRMKKTSLHSYLQSSV